MITFSLKKRFAQLNFTSFFILENKRSVILVLVCQGKRQCEIVRPDLVTQCIWTWKWSLGRERKKRTVNISRNRSHQVANRPKSQGLHETNGLWDWHQLWSSSVVNQNNLGPKLYKLQKVRQLRWEWQWKRILEAIHNGTGPQSPKRPRLFSNALPMTLNDTSQEKRGKFIPGYIKWHDNRIVIILKCLRKSR